MCERRSDAPSQARHATFHCVMKQEAKPKRGLGRCKIGGAKEQGIGAKLGEKEGPFGCQCQKQHAY